MSEENKFNPETVSLEELKAHIEAEAQAQVSAKVADEKTVVADKPATEVVVEEPDTEETTIFQRRIDLGDGSGVQVFQADSLEALVDKLVTAQENATKKIRELNSRVPKAEVKKERDPNDEFVLSQELMTKPTAAFAKMFQEAVGMPITDFKSSVERIKAFDTAQAANQASTEFVAQTPEYLAVPANGKRMQDYMKTYQLAPTVENLTKAFHELKETGLLQMKKAEVTEVTTETPIEEVKPVIVAEHARSAPKKAASGLSSKSGVAPTRPAKSGPSDAELYSMPLDKLKALANGKTNNDGGIDF